MGIMEIALAMKVAGFGGICITSLVAILSGLKTITIKSNNKEIEPSYTENDIENFCDTTNLVKQKKTQKEEFIFPKILNIEENTNVIEIEFDAKAFVLKDFEDRKELFLNNFKKAKTIKIEYNQNRNILVTLYKNESREIYHFKYTKCLDCEYFGGFDLYEKEIVRSLRRNLLIAGSIGMGKTSFVQGLILNRLWNNKNNSECIGTEISIIDLKGTDLVYFQECEGIEEIATNTTEAKKVLENIKSEIDKRNQIFRQKRVSSIEDYNEVSTEKMRYKYLILDEIATIQELEKKQKEELNNLITVIASKSRSFGIILIIATQRPDSKTLDSFTKAQLMNIVSFKVNNKYTSETVLGKEGAELIERVGQAITVENNKEILVQTQYINTKELKARIEKDIKRK